jgi:hypothetical protein
MTVGQHMKGHNQHRRNFYKGVIEQASRLVRNIRVHHAQLRCSVPLPDPHNKHSSPTIHPPLLQQRRSFPHMLRSKNSVKRFRKVGLLEHNPKEMQSTRRIAGMSLSLFSRLTRRIQ